MTTTAIVLSILALLIVLLMTHVIPYGVSAMICCVLLVFTGVFDLKTAFAGLSSSTTVMVAGMMVVAAALGKTNIVHRLKEKMMTLQGKSGFLLMGIIFLFTAILSQFMGQTPCIMMVLLFLQSMKDDGDKTPTRMLFCVAVVNTLMTSRFPIGMGATFPGMVNSYYQGMVDESQLIGMWDYFKAGIIPTIVAIVYCMFAYRLLPAGESLDESKMKEVKETQAMSKRDEIIVFLVFAAVTIGFMGSNIWGSSIANTIPAAAVLVLIVTKVFTPKEAVSHLTSDMVWMVAGMQVMSSALAASGVGELIGNFVLRLLGGNPSSIMVVTVFCVVTTVMTNFMSNLGTMALMTPIAASTALAGGMNVQTVVMIVNVSAWFAFAFPTGSSATVLAFGIGKLNPLKTLKFTLPLLVLCCISLIISVTIFFPIF